MINLTQTDAAPNLTKKYVATNLTQKKCIY